MNLFQEYEQLPDINIRRSSDGLRATVKYRHAGVNWHDEHYMAARGLVLDTVTGAILARPYRKFFNYGQIIHDDSFKDLAQWRNEPFTVEEKLDGSLAIVYYANGAMHLGSTGSPDFYDETTDTYVLDNVKHLVSEKTYQHLEEITHSGITLLFEYINPQHQIVVSYDKEMLVLHGGVHTKSGYDYSLAELHQLLPEKDILKAPVYPNMHTFADVKQALDKLEHKEGFVIRFESGFRLKMKTEEYLALAPRVTMFSNLTIKNITRWLALYDLDLLDDMTANIDDMPFANPTIKPHIEALYRVTSQFDELRNQAHVLENISPRDLFASNPDANILYQIWKNRDDGEQLQTLRYQYVLTQLRHKKTSFTKETFDELDDFFASMQLPTVKRTYQFN